MGDLGDVLDIQLAVGLTGDVVAVQDGDDTYVWFVETGTETLPDGGKVFLGLPRNQRRALASRTLGRDSKSTLRMLGSVLRSRIWAAPANTVPVPVHSGR